MRRQDILVVAALTMECLTSTGRGQDPTLDSLKARIEAKFGQSPALRCLRGLPGVALFVFIDVDPSGADALSTAAVTRDVELKLREAGIPVQVIPAVGPLPKIPSEYGSLSVSAKATGRDGLYAFAVRVELRQAMLLKREPALEIHGTSWEGDDALGTVGRENLGSIRDTIKDQLDEFCIDYLKANPRK